MSDLVVDVVFRGRVLETVPVAGAALRIGRMPANDIVLDNLGVSRFHARLLREDGRVLLEDAGSENGCLVNGQRLAGRKAIEPGDVIAIGKHELRIRRAAEGESQDPRPARRKSDAWDGARTYVLDAPPPLPESAASAPPPPAAPSKPPEPKEPIVMAATVSVQNAPAPDPTPDSDGQEIDFDFAGALSEDDAESPATVRFDAPTPPASAAPLHAGFIVQRQGKLERVVSWNGDVLVAGRAADCDLHLAQDEVSRRHVRFEHSGDRYEVIDLGSVNGTFVNGKRVERHALAVGDVVQVEGFQLTFVLDRNPLDGAVAAKPAPVATATRGDTFFAMTMLQEEMPHRPGFTEILAKPAPAAGPPATAPAEALAEAELLPDDIEAITASAEEEEKPVELTAARVSSRASSVQDLGRTSQPNLGAELRLELRVRIDLLPPALRRAFEEAGASELVLPAELCLKSP